MNITLDVTQYLDSRLPGHFTEDDRGWLIGSCLWHDDGKRPNLGIYAETGWYRCLSCGARGDLTKLIQRVEGLSSYDEAEQWIEDHYGIESEHQKISFKFGKPQRDIMVLDKSEWNPPDEDIFELYRNRHPYLSEERGISEEVQERFEVGYKNGSVTFPWRDRRGQLITVKFRAIFDKRFWYSPRVPAGRKATMLYGLHEVARTEAKVVWITEAEIDCLSLWQSGRAAVALGGSNMSSAQAYELALTGVERVVLTCDRDEAGRKAHRSIQKELKPYGIKTVEAAWPADAMITDKDGKERPVKDVNELLLSGRMDELTEENNSTFTIFKGAK